MKYTSKAPYVTDRVKYICYIFLKANYFRDEKHNTALKYFFISAILVPYSLNSNLCLHVYMSSCMSRACVHVEKHTVSL